jgi:hypothetical protein
MSENALHVSVDTLIAVAPMLGHELADHRAFRERQDRDLVRALQARTSVRLRDASQQSLFCIAPFDILITHNEQGKQFHMLEINGTGIGGLCNMSTDAIQAVLDDLSQTAEHLSPPGAVVLVASSGMEDDQAPRKNRALHEKILYVDALERGFELDERRAHIATMTWLAQTGSALPEDGPVIVLGYIKEFLEHLQMDDGGRLFLCGRQVHAAVNDRFCLNIMQRFNRQVDLRSLQTLNRCFHAGGDKGITYSLWNDYLKAHPHSIVGNAVRFERVFERGALIETIDRWVSQGRKTVIKPQGTGLGDGIVFFLDREDRGEIAKKVEASIRLTQDRYGLPGGAFPYTVCDFVDTATIQAKGHPLFGHKFELRIAVYRDGMRLKAFPTVVKIASEKYDPLRPSRLSLINNVTASTQAKKCAGTEFMLPLANRETWAQIGVDMDEMLEVCSAVTGFTRYLLDRVQDRPELLGLPAAPGAAHQADPRC